VEFGREALPGRMSSGAQRSRPIATARPIRQAWRADVSSLFMNAKSKQVLEAVGLKLAELAVSIVAGYLFNRWHPDAAPGLEWVIGSVLFLVMQMVELVLHANRASRQQREDLAALAGTMARENKERVLLQIGLSHAGRDLTESETNTAWRELMWYTQREYRATNFIDPGPFYKSGHARNVLQLQKAKLRAQEGFSLRKVLIWKDAAERASPEAKTIVEMHLDDDHAPMQLHGILRDEIDAKSSLHADLMNNLGGQIDFAVFDRAVVLRWKLDAARKVVGGSVTVDAGAVAKCAAFFDQLAIEAAPLKA
jgi:Family of unknown function (DUF6879)